MEKCVFCDRFIVSIKPVFENDLALAYFDEFPASKGHMLIITKRHVVTFFDASVEEQKAMLELLNKCKKYLDEQYKPDGYTVGLNCEKTAGQSVMHVHMHLIPRYKDKPSGGIRAMILSKDEMPEKSFKKIKK